MSHLPSQIARTRTTPSQTPQAKLPRSQRVSKAADLDQGMLTKPGRRSQRFQPEMSEAIRTREIRFSPGCDIKDQHHDVESDTDVSATLGGSSDNDDDDENESQIIVIPTKCLHHDGELSVCNEKAIIMVDHDDAAPIPIVSEVLDLGPAPPEPKKKDQVVVAAVLPINNGRNVFRCFLLLCLLLIAGLLSGVVVVVLARRNSE